MDAAMQPMLAESPSPRPVLTKQTWPGAALTAEQAALATEPALSEFERAVTAHARHYVALIEREGPFLRGDPEGKGRGQIRALKILGLELENLLEAVDTAVRRDAISWLVPLGEHFWSFLDIASEFKKMEHVALRLLAKGRDLSNVALEGFGEVALALVCQRLCRYDEALSAGIRAADLGTRLRRPDVQALGLDIAGLAKRSKGLTAEARSSFAEALEIAVRSDCHWCASYILNHLGILDFEQGDLNAARKSLQQARELHNLIGNPFALAQSISNLALIEIRENHLDCARSLLEASNQLSSELGNKRSMTISWSNLGNVESLLGHLATARGHYERALVVAQETGSLSNEASILGNLGLNRLEAGVPEAAEQFCLRELEIHQQTGYQLGQGVASRWLALIAVQRHDLQEARSRLEVALRIAEKYEARRDLAICCGLAGAIASSESQVNVAGPLLATAVELERSDDLRFERPIQAVLSVARSTLETAGQHAAPQELKCAVAIAGWFLRGTAIAIEMVR